MLKTVSRPWLCDCGLAIYGSSFGWHFPLVQHCSQLALQHCPYTFSALWHVRVKLCTSVRTCHKRRSQPLCCCCRVILLQRTLTSVAEYSHKDLNTMWCKEVCLCSLMALILVSTDKLEWWLKYYNNGNKGTKYHYFLYTTSSSSSLLVIDSTRKLFLSSIQQIGWWSGFGCRKSVSPGLQRGSCPLLSLQLELPEPDAT